MLFNAYFGNCHKFNEIEATSSLTMDHKEAFGWKIGRNSASESYDRY